MSALQHPVLNGMSPCKQYSNVAIVIIFLISVAFHKNFSQSRMAYTYSVLQHTMAKVAKLLTQSQDVNKHTFIVSREGRRGP